MSLPTAANGNIPEELSAMREMLGGFNDEN
jgi:hypothetical protein